MNYSTLTKQTATFCEKILTDRRGVSVRVTFAVICTAGIREIRIISATPILTLTGYAASPTQVALPTSLHTAYTAEKTQPEDSVPSPYFSTTELFLTSQMTRAPAAHLLPIV